MSRIELTAASRLGNVRKNNEDMVLAYDRLIRSNAYQTEFMTENTESFVVAVADGMGGHRAGEVASELAMDNLKFFVGDLPRGMMPDEVKQKMSEWLQSAHLMVNSRGLANPSLREMGTTLVGLLYYAGHYFWMNCGDSRLYRLRDRHLTQITKDHSLNALTGETKHSNVITNCIGAGAKTAFLDIEEMTDDFCEGDVYLLCSDGLNDMVNDHDIEQLLCEGASASTLCAAAVDAGGYDNVSALVLNVKKSL
jgi:protein phosphatase